MMTFFHRMVVVIPEPAFKTSKARTTKPKKNSLRELMFGIWDGWCDQRTAELYPLDVYPLGGKGLQWTFIQPALKDAIANCFQGHITAAGRLGFPYKSSDALEEAIPEIRKWDYWCIFREYLPGILQEINDEAIRMIKERSSVHLAASRDAAPLIRPRRARRANPEPVINPFRGSSSKALEARRISENLALGRDASETLPRQVPDGGGSSTVIPQTLSTIILSSPILPIDIGTLSDSGSLPPLPPPGRGLADQEPTRIGLHTSDGVYTDVGFKLPSMSPELPVEQGMQQPTMPVSEASYTNFSFRPPSDSPEPTLNIPEQEPQVEPEGSKRQTRSASKRRKPDGSSPELPRATRSRTRAATHRAVDQ